MQQEQRPFIDSTERQTYGLHAESGASNEPTLDEYADAMIVHNGQLIWEDGELVTAEDIENIDKATSFSKLGRDGRQAYVPSDSSRPKLHIALMHGDENIASVAEVDERDLYGLVMYAVQNRMLNDARLARARLNPPYPHTAHALPSVTASPAPRVYEDNVEVRRAGIVEPQAEVDAGGLDTQERGQNIQPGAESERPLVRSGAQTGQGDLVDDLPGVHSLPSETPHKQVARRTPEKYARAKGIAKKTAGALILSHVLYAAPSYMPIVGWDEHILARAIVDGDFNRGIDTIRAVTSHVPFIGNIVK